MSEFKAGDRVETTRYLNEHAVERATVVEVRKRDYVVRFDLPGRHDGAPRTVGRYARDLRPLEGG